MISSDIDIYLGLVQESLALGLPVIEASDHGGETVAALVGDGRALFVRVRLHQGGIDIEDRGG